MQFFTYKQWYIGSLWYIDIRKVSVVRSRMDRHCSAVEFFFFFSSIAANYRQYFEKILRSEPDNPPNLDVYKVMIERKAAVNALKGAALHEKLVLEDMVTV